MPTRLDTNFARLSDADEFESMIRDICALEWDDPHTEKHGRSGQKQYGVDIYGCPSDLNGKYYAAQCKLRKTNAQLSKTEIELEVGEARQFSHPLALLILVTDTLRDANTQLLVRKISEAEQEQGGFRIVIWFWDDITARLSAYPKLIVKYYRDYFANLTALPLVERLVDTPLQLLCFNQPPSNSFTALEGHLVLRGLRIVRATNLAGYSHVPVLNDLLPDGLLFQYSTTTAESEDTAILQFASTVFAYTQLVERNCALFVLLPSSLKASFTTLFGKFAGDLNHIQILDSVLSPIELADYLLSGVFSYGYARRGGLATLNVAVRTREGRPHSVLLDLDWCIRLGINHFPTYDEWNSVLMPALLAVKRQLLSQNDSVRIQFHCQLPLPAAFALGFIFNVRVARVGVWARQTGVSDFKQQFWLSDGNGATINDEPFWVQRPQHGSRTAVVELTSYVAIHHAVKAFVDKMGITIDAWVQVPLTFDGKPKENLEESHAIAYAKQVAQLIRTLNEQGITDIHLFARIPAALAVLIGQRLLACGRIHLYWFDNPTYRFAFMLT